ncbi:heme exporter protein CcmD [Alphaproteobacteria bacterium GH1-50]|uniref:Heme exporter protein D n=1 Tax=Kangsaoukella pontilimi TaxID=2691042 RepID=A0A7C9MEG6_9RHOB|nr:heme exporter protein CcmD [Kangsaoukella pontilimi]MXQ07016.1 heme exporter protein CcmD [Kangsaoukella pontilimi]
MPDLGAYAFEVSLAYAGSLLALGIVIWASVARAARVRRTLDEAEKRWSNKNG